MKIEAVREDVLEALQKVQSAVPLKSALPILSSLMMEAKGGAVTMFATDLDMGIAVPLKASVKEEGAITVPARRFMDIVKEMPASGSLRISEKKDGIVAVACSKILFRIRCEPKENFPTIPKFKIEGAVTISQESFKGMISMTEFAMSDDEARYVLNGELLVIGGKSVTMAATDGRRLAVMKKKTAGGAEKKVILQAKAVRELGKMLGDEGDVSISFGDNQVRFDFGGASLVSRLIEGDFPDYESVIPDEMKEKATVGREALLAAMRRAAVLASIDSAAVSVVVSKGRMEVFKSEPNIGEVREDIKVGYDGAKITVGFNPRYIIDGLKCMNAESVGLEIGGEDKPCVMCRDTEYVYVILPMQIAQEPAKATAAKE